MVTKKAKYLNRSCLKALAISLSSAPSASCRTVDYEHRQQCFQSLPTNSLETVPVRFCLSPLAPTFLSLFGLFSSYCNKKFWRSVTSLLSILCSCFKLPRCQGENMPLISSVSLTAQAPEVGHSILRILLSSISGLCSQWPFLSSSVHKSILPTLSKPSSSTQVWFFHFTYVFKILPTPTLCTARFFTASLWKALGAGCRSVFFDDLLQCFLISFASTFWLHLMQFWIHKTSPPIYTHETTLLFLLPLTRESTGSVWMTYSSFASFKTTHSKSFQSWYPLSIIPSGQYPLYNFLP